LYLAYRRDGGENHSPAGRLCHHLTASLLSGDADQASQALDEFARRFSDDPNAAPLVGALQAILSGKRTRPWPTPPSCTTSSSQKSTSFSTIWESRSPRPSRNVNPQSFTSFFT
jgi:hypothetical protein